MTVRSSNGTHSSSGLGDCSDVYGMETWLTVCFDAKYLHSPANEISLCKLEKDLADKLEECPEMIPAAFISNQIKSRYDNV